MPSTVARQLALYTAVAIIFLAVLLNEELDIQAFPRLNTILQAIRSPASITYQQFTSISTNNVTMTRTPVYFVSHGGPTTMYNTTHPAYSRLESIGCEITQQVRPSAILVFSAHWQANRPNTIEVNTSEQEPLLYDFYGFPKHYYLEEYPNSGSPRMAKRVMQMLTEAGIEAVPAARGLDHGVFVPFKIMFSPEKNPVDVPIVQVSLFNDDTDAAAHIRLGRAVQKLREENVQIIVSGMAVHNLGDMRVAMSQKRTMPYTVSFDRALQEAVETEPGDGRDRAMEGLLKRTDAKGAHPTFEHLLPIHVAVGAAGEDKGEMVWTMPEGSASWGQYRFGDAAD